MLFRSTPLNQITWIAVVLLVAVFTVFNVRICSQIEQSIKQGAPAETAIANAFGNTFGYSVRFYIAIGAIGLLFSILFSKSTNWITKIFTGLLTADVYTSFGGVGTLRFISSIIMILFFNILERGCMNSLASVRAFDHIAAKEEEK